MIPSEESPVRPCRDGNPTLASQELFPTTAKERNLTRDVFNQCKHVHLKVAIAQS